MHFLTSIYGSTYVPFLRVFLASLQQTHPESRTTVYWDDLPTVELELLRQAFPRVEFVRSAVRTAGIEAVNVRIPFKMRLWNEMIQAVEDGELICLLDSDVLVTADIGALVPPDADVIFTWKAEQFPLNTGVVIARMSSAVRAFFEEWKRETVAVIEDPDTLSLAVQRFGAGDQYALARVLNVGDYTSPFTRTIDGEVLRFVPMPCRVLNETNAKPINETTRVFHLKGGWHPILLEDGPFGRWRTPEDTEDVGNYWKNLDSRVAIASWRSYVLSAVAANKDHFPVATLEEHVDRGMLHSELLAVIALVRELDIDVVIESGRYLGHSTKVLAEGLEGTSCTIHSTELFRNEVGEQAEARLEGYENLRLHYGDAAEVVPRLLQQEQGKRVAILLDGPKGRDAFRLLSDSIARHENVVVGFIHDLRESYPGMLNPNRIYVHEYFERIFFTDDEEYVDRYRELDVVCSDPGFWEPYHVRRRRIGSYGPTLGVILPTARDRFRARKRLERRRADERTRSSAESSSQAEAQPRPRKSLRYRLHRMPGYTLGKEAVKRLVRSTGASSPGESPAAPEPPPFQLRADSAPSDTGVGDIVIDCHAHSREWAEPYVSSGAMIYLFGSADDVADRFADEINVVCFPFSISDTELSSGGAVLVSASLSHFLRFTHRKTVRVLRFEIEVPVSPVFRTLVADGLIDGIERVIVSVAPGIFERFLEVNRSLIDRLTPEQRGKFEFVAADTPRRSMAPAHASRPRDAVFVWIPKTAGSTVFRSLEDHSCRKLKTLDRIEEDFDQEGLVTFGHISYRCLVSSGAVSRDYDRSAFKFCFVRDPYERAVSLFAYLKKIGRLPEDGSFDAFAELLVSGEVPPVGLQHIEGLSHCNPQVAWTEGIELDAVGKVESFERDFNAILERLGLPKQAGFPRVNAIPRPASRTFYSSESKAMIEDYYAADFEAFGYPYRSSL